MAAPGCVPAEYTCTVSPAVWRIRPAAICDLPAFFTHTNSTEGLAVLLIDSWSGDRGDVQFGEQAPDALFDVVADRAHGVDGLPVGVGQDPFLVAVAREHRAAVTAAH